MRKELENMRRAALVDAVEREWGNEIPHDAVKLCQSIFKAFGKTVNQV